MQARDVMNLLVYRCHEEDSVEACARLMREQNIGFIPVVDHGDRLVGVVTDRDLVLRVLAAGRPATTMLGEIATRAPLLVCAPEDDLRVVEQRMSSVKKGRVLVVDAERRCLGVISLSNVAQAEPDGKRVGALLNQVTHREAVQLARR